jgi:tol-pal system protein YbgF
LNGCPQPAPSQTKDGVSPQVEQKLDYLNDRIHRLEQNIHKLSRTVERLDQSNRQGKADQSVINEELRSELRTLKGSQDVQQHDLESYIKKNQKIQQDMDARFSDLENRTQSSRAPTPQTHPTATEADKREPTGTDDIARYNQILRIILDKKEYDIAIKQFREFIKTYPASSLADNAQYWIGEGYFAKGDYQKSITEFQKVLELYPDSKKMCDSLLKQGFAFSALNNPKNSQLFLSEVIRRCPKSQYSARAEDKLKDLAGSGAKQ